MARTGLILLAIAAVAGGVWWISGVRAPRSGDGEERRETSLGVDAPSSTPPNDSGGAGTLPTVVMVVDPDGEPVAGARVELHSWPSWLARPPEPSAAVDSDGDGRAVVHVSTDPKVRTTLVVRREGSGIHHRWLEPGTPEVRVTLRPACTLEGRVVDVDGRPVPSARLCAAEGPGIAVAPTTVSDPDGRYRLEDLAPGHIDLAAGRSGARPKFVGTLDVPRVSRFDVVLPPACVLRGRVLVDGTDRPVEGAVVVARSGWRAVTDGQGRYELRGLPPGAREIDVEAPGYLLHRREYDVTPWVDESGPTNRDLRVVPTSFVRGVLRDTSGSPIDGARVQADGASEWTDADGRYVFEVAPGTYLLEPGPRTVTVQAGETTVVDLVALQWQAVEGRVVDADKKPVAGLEVSFHAEPRGGRARTDSEGRFRTRVADEDGLIRAHYFLLPCNGSSTATDLVLRGDPAAVEIVLPRRRWIRVHGTVTPPSGVRPGDCRVRVTGTSTDRSHDEVPIEYRWTQAWTTEVGVAPDGRYELSHSTDEPGIEVVAHGRGVTPCRSVIVALEPGQEDVRVDLRLESGLVLRGKAVGPAGEPISGAAVTLERQSNGETGHGPDPIVRAVSGPDGTFAIPHLPAGEFVMTVRAVGRVGIGIPVTLPISSSLAVVLPPARTIRGRVRCLDGSPPGLVGIHFEPVERDSGRWLTRPPSGAALSGTDGVFVIRDLPPGPCELRVRSFRRDPCFLPLEMTVEAGRQDLDLVVSPGLTISGRVLGPDGSPCSPARIEALNDDGCAVDYDVADDDGTFVVPGLPLGMYRLRVNAPSARQAIVGAVKAGTTGIEIRLVAGLAVAGVVVDADGKPVPDLRLNGVGTDDRGRFRIEGLAEGPYEIRLSGNHHPFELSEKTVVEAGREDVKIVVVRERMLRGRAVDGSGRPVRGARVEAESLDGDHTRGTETALDGTFELRVIPTRRYRIEVRAEIGSIRLKDVPGDREELHVRVPRWPSVSGVAFDVRGTPLRGARIQIDPKGWPDVETRTDDSGRFLFHAVPPGRHPVWAFVPEPGAGRGIYGLGDVEAGATGVVLRPEK